MNKMIQRILLRKRTKIEMQRIRKRKKRKRRRRRRQHSFRLIVTKERRMRILQGQQLTEKNWRRKKQRRRKQRRKWRNEEANRKKWKQKKLTKNYHRKQTQSRVNKPSRDPSSGCQVPASSGQALSSGPLQLLQQRNKERSPSSTSDKIKLNLSKHPAPKLKSWSTPPKTKAGNK